MVKPVHPSNSTVQSNAETAIIASLADLLGIDLVLGPRQIQLNNGAHVVVDAATEDLSVVVEAYAHQGRLKGAQPKKIAQDILKLALIRQQPGHRSARAIIALADQAADDSITGWLREAAATWQIEIMTVNLPAELKDSIRAAQTRQVMVNVDQVVDEVT